MRLTTTGMIELLRFKAYFKQYGFKWMTRAPKKYSEVLVREFYAAYKNELKRQYPHGQLWKSGDPIPLLTIRGVRVDISLCTIGQFLHGLDYQPPVNIGEMYYHLEEMQKIVQK